MHGLKGKRLKERVRELALRYEVSEATIYRVTEDVRAKRKKRSDAGKRRADLLEHDGLGLAAELVATKNLDPDLALETARLNGHETPVATGTFQRYLREHAIDRRTRQAERRPHRRWEAQEPCELFQFDISGVKERWLDLSTRRLLHVSDKDVNENHPNRNPNRVKVWKFTLIDDFSRRRYFRFFAIDKPTSIEVITFLLDAFRTLGVPQTLYTDNDVIIISKRMKRAESILNKAFEESGGFALKQHAPHNAQATGKVERSHQVVEKFEKLIALKHEVPTIEALNEFAETVCDRLDWEESRATGEKPMLRWRSTNTALRVPPPAVLDAAFKAEEFMRRLNEDLTISYKGEAYQLPRKRPFVDWITKTLQIVWPAGEADWFVVIGADGVDYEVSRTNATADAAGEFKAVPETKRQQSMKVLNAKAKERKERERETGEALLVPGFDAAFEAKQEPRPVVMPKVVVEMPVERLAEAAPGAIQPSLTASGRWLTYWAAVKALVEEGAFDPESESFAADKAWLKGTFGTQEELAESEIRAALAAREAQDTTVESSTVLQFRRA